MAATRKPSTEINNEAQRNRFEALVAAWDIAEKKLADLAKEEDKLLDAETDLPTKLDEQICDQLEIQSRIVGDLISTRAVSLDEICAKLSIWHALKFPGNTEFSALEQSDLLVRQAILELNKLRENTTEE